MKRSKLGDLFSIKVSNGYKLFQRAYDVPRKGQFIRVFDGLYSVIPDDVTGIVSGPHSYILNFDAIGAYRCGLAQLVGNYPVPSVYPFPEYMFKFSKNADGKSLRISIVTTDLTDLHVFNIVQLSDLPDEFQNLTLLWPVFSVAKVLYMFDSNWNPKQLCNTSSADLDEGFLLNQNVYLDMVEQSFNNMRI